MMEAREVLQALIGQAEAVTLEPLRPAVMSPVHIAVENDLWKVRLDDGKEAVLRILHPEMAEEFDREAMIAGARAAAKAGVAPQLLASDSGLGAMLLEYLGEGWRTGTMWDLYQPEVRRAVVAALEQLHRSQPIAQRFEPIRKLDDVTERAKQAGTPLPADFDWLNDSARLIAANLADGATQIALCRNDGASSNILLHEDGSVRLIDFDQAGMNDPAYDLGTLVAEGAVFEDEALDWVAGEGEERRRLLYRAQLWGAFDDLLWATRTALKAHVSERIHVEFKKYSEWRFMRARRVISDSRCEWMLRAATGRLA